ncbi:MAG: SurA N-terminal domain-containing protein [Sulfobacillus sp.]
MNSTKLVVAAILGAGAMGLTGALAFAGSASPTRILPVAQTGTPSQSAIIAAVQNAKPDMSLPAIVATVNGQPIGRKELAAAEEVLGNGTVTNPDGRSIEEAALNMLIDTTVADQAARAQGLDPTESEAKAQLQVLLTGGSPLANALSGSGIDPSGYANPKMVGLYQLAAGRAALERKVTSKLPQSQWATAWANYVTGLVSHATIVKYGGL